MKSFLSSFFIGKIQQEPTDGGEQSEQKIRQSNIQEYKKVLENHNMEVNRLLELD